MNDQTLELYKIIVDSSEKLSEKRQQTNNYFFAITTGIVSLSGVLSSFGLTNLSAPWALALSISGIVVCYTWHRMIRSYKDLSTAKFKVIHEIEERFEVSPYKQEWMYLGEGKDKNKYLPFTEFEKNIPWIFIILFSILSVWSIFKMIF